MYGLKNVDIDRPDKQLLLVCGVVFSKKAQLFDKKSRFRLSMGAREIKNSFMFPISLNVMNARQLNLSNDSYQTTTSTNNSGVLFGA